MSSAIPSCRANQLLFSVYRKVIYEIFCVKFSGLRKKRWLFIIYLFVIIVVIFVDRAPEGAIILRISPFSLKKGTC